MNRIISKEEERTSKERTSIFIPTRIQEYPVILPTRTPSISTQNTVLPVSPHAIQQLQVILHTELILSRIFQEILQLQGS